LASNLNNSYDILWNIVSVPLKFQYDRFRGERGMAWQQWNIIVAGKRGEFGFNGCSLLKNRSAFTG
jgi:hypothetical protein